jgi:hypothetical protein
MCFFLISIPSHNGLDNNDDYFSIAPVTLHETLMFQWRIICHMHSEEAVSEHDAAFIRLILQWILSPSPLCFALSSQAVSKGRRSLSSSFIGQRLWI